MRHINRSELGVVAGGYILMPDGVTIIVPSDGIPLDKFNALEYGFQKYINDEWDDCYLNVYLCATNSYPYQEIFMDNMLWHSYIVSAG